MKSELLFGCWDCEGTGESFYGNTTNGAPDCIIEIWDTCETCDGTGRTWKYFWMNVKQFVYWQLYVPIRYRKPVEVSEEDDIPF